MLNHGSIARNALADPRWRQPIQIVRLLETVNDNGRSARTTENISGFAVIYPASQSQLQTLPEATRTRETIAVITELKLIAESDGVAGDRLIWNGTEYRVQSRNAYIDYGFTEAIAQNIGPQVAQ